jgi:NitT/TauT family transport system permease protein
MAQIHEVEAPAARPGRSRVTRVTRVTRAAGGAVRYDWWVDVFIVALIVAVVYGVVLAASHWVAPLTPATSIDLSPRALPLYAGLSTLRMALAYVLSLVFSLIYARIAARNRSAERAMIPLLDILQSIPILSFLPGVVLGLVALFPHSNVGLELAAILLIFTSQAWNMAFSFYHSLLVIPKELHEAATVYRLNSWRRFTRLELPFGMIPLIWNSMMSWAGGWFFLMAAEQFTLGSHSFQLPGLGSYLATAANAGNVGALLLGLATLIVVIVLLDQLLWRPLIAWADRFKVEQTTSGQTPTSWVLRGLRRSALIAWASDRFFQPAREWVDRSVSQLLATRPQPVPRMALGSTRSEAFSVASQHGGKVRRTGARQVAGWVVGGIVLVLCLWGTLAAARLLAGLSLSDWGLIVVSALATLLRTTVALAIGVAWTVPVGVAIGLNPRLAQRAQPLVQMVASIPATALFPALLLILLRLPSGLNIAAIALMLLGTQWYVLFNVIAGAMAIPTDLREAAAVFQLHGWCRWRTLILPAIFPALVTGMITATGGAWNASIVAEYVTFNGHVYQAVGLGALIASSANGQDFALLLGATLAMAAVVVAINLLVWHRLYALAEQRFHLD